PEAPHVVLEYAYDKVGNVLSVSDFLEGMAAGVTDYQYDPLNRVDRMQQSGAGVMDKRVDFAYNQVGQLASIDRFSDLVGANLVAQTSFDYDTLNRLQYLEHANDLEIVASYEFTHDALSRITSIAEVD